MSAREDIAAHFTSETLIGALLHAYRAEVLADAADWLGSVGETNAAYLLRTCDIAATGTEEKTTPTGAAVTSQPGATETDPGRRAAWRTIRDRTDDDLTPDPDARLQQLLIAVRTHTGPWTTRRVQRLYKRLGFEGIPKRVTARRDLAALHEQGWLVLLDEQGRRSYTLNTLKGDA